MFMRVRDYVLIFAGAAIQALSMALFYVPVNLAAGGVSGLAQIIGNFSGARAQINPLEVIVRVVDPGAFVVIGEAHEALGVGFEPLKPP